MSQTHWVVTAFTSCFVAVFGGFVSAADESPAATIRFGEVSLELGMEKGEVITALEPTFLVQMMPPDPMSPDLLTYSVHGREHLPTPLTSQVGHITLKDGKLQMASRRMMGGNETLDSQELVTRLTDLLLSVSQRVGISTPRIQSDDGVFQGRKISNREISFDYGLERVAVVYYDSPGGSQRVTLTVQIGKN